MSRPFQLCVSVCVASWCRPAVFISPFIFAAGCDTNNLVLPDGTRTTDPDIGAAPGKCEDWDSLGLEKYRALISLDSTLRLSAEGWVGPIVLRWFHNG